jgi:hypothetical protein
MARKRMIDPAFFLSKTLNALPIPVMVTFAGIWCWADDYGRGEDDAALVAAAIWPRRKSVTERNVAAHLDALVAAGVLCRYQAEGYEVIHVVNWDEFQKVSHPTPSRLPACHIDHENVGREF